MRKVFFYEFLDFAFVIIETIGREIKSVVVEPFVIWYGWVPRYNVPLKFEEEYVFVGSYVVS